MNSKSLSILAAFAVIGLSGCASMSADECMTVDWTTIGYEDGSRGYTADRLGSQPAIATRGVDGDEGVRVHDPRHAEGE